MRVLIVGGGGREHALADAMAAQPDVTVVAVAPGNAGIARRTRCEAVPVDDVAGLTALAVALRADLVLVGPELPLVLGLIDRLQAAGIAALGPSAAAARLESSKAFMKGLCTRLGIPTAAYASFGRDEATLATAYLAAQPLPVVVKADGLAAGKGVVVAAGRAEAEAALAAALARPEGRVVIEAFLHGREASLFALCNGRDAQLLGTARDHKRAHDGDRGPNTGGMGAVAPSPDLRPDLVAEVMARIVGPTLAGMAAAGTPFHGILYAGLMLGADGPQLIEYNVRLGDPEAQAMLPLLHDPALARRFLAAAQGQAMPPPAAAPTGAAVAVVMASRGYPDAPGPGGPIGGLDLAMRRPDTRLSFGAGMTAEGGGWRAGAGRALTVTGLGADPASARAEAYAAVAAIDWPAGFHRLDIAAA